MPSLSKNGRSSFNEMFQGCVIIAYSGDLCCTQRAVPPLYSVVALLFPDLARVSEFLKIFSFTYFPGMLKQNQVMPFFR